MDIIETLPAVQLNTERGPVIVGNPIGNPLESVALGIEVHIAQREEPRGLALCGTCVVGGRRSPGAPVTCGSCKANHRRVIVWACNEVVTRLNDTVDFTV